MSDIINLLVKENRYTLKIVCLNSFYLELNIKYWQINDHINAAVLLQLTIKCPILAIKYLISATKDALICKFWYQ